MVVVLVNGREERGETVADLIVVKSDILVADTVAYVVLTAGQYVVYVVMISVVTLPTGQFVTVVGQAVHLVVR